MSFEFNLSPRVSVIIPVFNYERFLRRALESVFAQTYHDYEIIVVDDGSTDSTPDIAYSYGPRIRYIRKDNGGVSSARNVGIQNARGVFIAFLDADDAWLENKLEKQVSYMEHNSCYAMSYTDMSHCVNGCEVHKSYLHERGYNKIGIGRIYLNLLEEVFIFVPTVMIKAEIFQFVGLFDEGLTHAEDWEIWLRIADDYEIGFIDESLTIRHEHGSGATSRRNCFHQGQIEVLSRVLASSNDLTRLAIARRQRCNAFWHLGYQLFVAGELTSCRQSMFKFLADGGQFSKAYKYIIFSFVSLKWIRFFRNFISKFFL